MVLDVLACSWRSDHQRQQTRQSERGRQSSPATVSVPISDWWGGSHAIKRRKIEHQQAQEQLADNAELLKIRMQNAWNGVQEAYRQLQLSERSIEQAEENLRLNRDYYRAGTSRMSDLLEAQLLYQQSLDKHTDAFADYQNKLLEYRQAIGHNAGIE